MAFMPGVQEQDPPETPPGYGNEKLPLVLSQVQAGDPDQRKTTENICSQRAGRIDAEPIEVSMSSFQSALFVRRLLYEKI